MNQIQFRNFSFSFFFQVIFYNPQLNERWKKSETQIIKSSIACSHKNLQIPFHRSIQINDDGLKGCWEISETWPD